MWWIHYLVALLDVLHDNYYLTGSEKHLRANGGMFLSFTFSNLFSSAEIAF
jgi:hypothetical protein